MGTYFYAFNNVIPFFFGAVDTEEFSAFTNLKVNEENISKIHTIYDSDSQLGASAKEKDRASNLGLDHFMKTFLYCRRAMVI
jgi:hypothetical protein